MLPDPPHCSFASDNAAAVHPAVIEALAAANAGHALAYGADRWTDGAVARFRELFESEVEVLFSWGGTGANVVGLQCLLRPADAVICPGGAHINVDEGGAFERFTGAKLIDLECPDGKLRPEQVEAQLHVLGDEHHVQPAVVAITQSTEIGTLYQPDEIAALADVAHRAGLRLHLDGARIANAVAALGGDLLATTRDAGVDVMTFGGTKNGLMYGEAIVFFDPELAARAKFIRKQAGQLVSKMRFVSAQFSALLTDGLWLDLAGHANAMATRLHLAASAVPGVGLDGPPAVNSLFPVLPAKAAAELSDWTFFWPWDPATSQYRWMTSWDTTDADVDRFVEGVAAAMATVG